MTICTSPTAIVLFAPDNRISEVALCVTCGVPSYLTIFQIPADTVPKLVIVVLPVMSWKRPSIAPRSHVAADAMSAPLDASQPRTTFWIMRRLSSQFVLTVVVPAGLLLDSVALHS